MSEAVDDFVVIDEDAPDPQKVAVERLNVLVECLSKSLNSVTQSTILLKDVVSAALTVTLQHSSPDSSTQLEELLKTLKETTTSAEEVRSNYVENMGSHLVAVNEKAQALLEENESLKQKLSSKDEILNKQLQAVLKVTREIQSVLKVLEDSESGNSTTPSETDPGQPNLDIVCQQLIEIRNRLSKIDITPPIVPLQSVPEKADGISQTRPTMCVSTSCQYQPHNRDLETQTSLPDRPSSSIAPENVPLPDSPTNSSIIHLLASTALPKIGARVRRVFQTLTPDQDFEPAVEESFQSQIRPSFSASEERPWCPCCGQLFASRDELETHLPGCLD